MEKSKLYNILDSGLLHKWRERIEKDENEACPMTSEQEVAQALESVLDEKSRALLISYSLAIENRMDDIHHSLKIKILNLGIQIGMELQKSFAEYD